MLIVNCDISDVILNDCVTTFKGEGEATSSCI